jgi:hypothetical protein
MLIISGDSHTASHPQVVVDGAKATKEVVSTFLFNGTSPPFQQCAEANVILN